MLKSGGNPLISALRGQPTFRRTPVAPDGDIKSEISELKNKGVPLRKINQALTSMGKTDFIDKAKQIYFGLKEPLTKIDFRGGQQGFRQQSPELVEKGQSLLETAKTEIPKTTMETFALPGRLAEESARESGIPGVIQAAPLIGLGADIIAPGPGEFKSGAKVFKGFKDLTTKVLERLKGKSITSKQEILDFTNMPDLKQAERDLIRNVANDFDKDVPVQEFANKVKTELLPLKVSNKHPDFLESGVKHERAGTTRTGFEMITLPDEVRGPVANYYENVYQSPIKTSAGGVHYGQSAPNYFAHTRIEDLPTKGAEVEQYLGNGKYKKFKAEGEPTRRVIELQSDLFQKGKLKDERGENLKQMISRADERRDAYFTGRASEYTPVKQLEKELAIRESEVAKLEPYRNTWHERVIREEVKQAAQDGKTKLQFPTGETALRIEGLIENRTWTLSRGGSAMGDLTPNNVRVGEKVFNGAEDWIITKDLSNGQFKAIPERQVKAMSEKFPQIPKTEIEEFIKNCL